MLKTKLRKKFAHEEMDIKLKSKIIFILKSEFSKNGFKMKKSTVLIFFLLLVANLFPQNYKKVKYFLNSVKDVKAINSLGIATDDGNLDLKEKSLTLFISDNEFQKLSKLNLRKEVIIDDWFTEYKNRYAIDASTQEMILQKSKEVYGVKSFSFGSMGGFYTLQEVINKLDTMYLQYPNLITQKFQVGTSIEGRPIYAVKISDNPNQNEDEPEVFFNALTHAREPEGMMVVMYYMFYLLENYGVNPEVTYLVNNRQIYFIPVVNVDGYEYNRTTNPSGGGMWRKNKRSPYGVDINRNYGYMWGYDNVGSSGDPNDETYRGSAAFSEPETQAMRDFCYAHNFKTTLNYHTYGNDLIFPWGYVNKETVDSSAFREFAADITQYNNYIWGTGGDLMYLTNGDVDDWMYGEQTTKQKILSMTPEAGTDGFWPAKTNIFPIAQENLLPNLYITWVASGYVALKSFSFDKDYFNPGDNVQLNVILKNKGLGNADNINVQLTSLTEGITVANPAQIINQIPSRTEYALTSPFEFSISQDISISKKVKLLLTVFLGSVQMSADTISLNLGTPQEVFADNNNDLSVLWSGAGLTLWSNTTSIFYSAPNSYTDSKNGLYANNTNSSITLKNAVDLTGTQNPFLSFWTRYDIETGWDYGQVKFSTNNGSTWIALHGKYNHIGSGSFQPNAEYVYDGVRTEWVKEEIDLSSLSGKQVKVRFELHTDSYEQKDGWYIDDIGIYHYMVVPVELASFTAATQESFVILSWTTASEINNLGFYVQKSSDKTNWNDLEFINGKGTTSNYSEYQYIDHSPIYGKSYYRLVQQDLDGSQKILKSLEVNFKGKIKFALEQNYPNPFNPATVIKYSIPNNGSETGLKVQLKVFDVLGNEVETLVNEMKQPGNYSVEFNAQNLTSGIYIYQLKTGEFVASRKMTVIK